MTQATKNYYPAVTRGLTRNPKGEGSYSASGIYGDATLPTRQKGKILVRAIVDGILQDIQGLRKSH